MAPAPETDKLNSNMMSFKALMEIVWITVMFKQHAYDFLTLCIFVSFQLLGFVKLIVTIVDLFQHLCTTGGDGNVNQPDPPCEVLF